MEGKEISVENKTSKEIRGLVLAGGFSKRMGQDKGLISYHGIPHRIYLYHLLKRAGLSQVHISCRTDQIEELHEFRPLADAFTPAGPMAALLTAFEENAHVAWLVLACDLPLMDLQTVQYLISHRDPSKIATAFRSPEDNFPEPLIAIWEPASQALLMDSYQKGKLSPRKVMLHHEICLLDAPNPQMLSNVNDPEALKSSIDQIKRSKE